MTKKRTFSTIIDRDELADGKRGVRPYNREQIYRWLYEHSDHRGIVIFSQRDVAKQLEIGYQNICNIYHDFVETGHMIKYGKFYEIVYDPDELDWGESFRQTQSAIRKEHQVYYNYQKGEINE